MIAGFDSFRERFKDYSDCYTIIGGAACDILMSKSDFSFRATKDIDMILILEDRGSEFAKVFWDYILAGHYKFGWKNNNETHYYRFTEPKAGYPVQIELFSRLPKYALDIPGNIVPVHIDDEVSSLSAILLNDDFFNFMMQGRRIVDDVPILGAEYLIPFKMYAWLDLLNSKTEGKHVNEHDFKKHKYDVFRLLQIVEVGTHIATSGLVKKSISEFIDKITSESLPLDQIGIDMTKADGIEILKDIYLSC